MQKTQLLKKLNKLGENISTLKHQITHQIIFFLYSLGCTLSVCTVSFVGKIVEEEKHEVIISTLTFAWAGPIPGPKAIGQ